MRSLSKETDDAERVLNDPAERNECRGFLGTIGHADAHAAWMLAMSAIAKATGCSDEAIRAFLDSRYGRHVADEIGSAICSGRHLAAAVDDLVERWMNRRIDAASSGSRRGLPYLTGFVCMHEALLEGAA